MSRPSGPPLFSATYYPTQPAQPAAPLGRYFAPPPDSAALAWLAEMHPVNNTGWVLDPFSSSPELIANMARAGYRVLAAAHNPITRFLIEIYANPPTLAEMKAALAELAASFKGDERLELHLRALYTIPCQACQSPVEVEAFLWEKQAGEPYAALYTCPTCKSAGEHPLDDTSRPKTTASAHGLHQARALERIAAQDDADRQHASEALSHYLPRSIYVLFNLINKLEGLTLSAQRRRCLHAMLLTALDQGSNLWPYPATRDHPRQLTTPPRFRENNLWLALEHSLEQWAALAAEPVTVTTWPNQPSGGGICLFEGRLRDLLGRIGEGGGEPGLVAAVAVLPRPNQAFWTLSAMWAGWLWGRSAVSAFKSVLRRRRYDWAWHTAGLQSALASLAASAAAPAFPPSGLPVLALSSEGETGLVHAALLAAHLAGFKLEHIAMQAELRQVQIHWRSQPGTPPANPPASGPPDALRQLAGQSARLFLNTIGQPASYLSLSTAALVGLVSSPLAGLLSPSQDAENIAQVFIHVQGEVREALGYRYGFLRYRAREHPDSGYWWLREAQDADMPIADQVEMMVVQYLQKHPGCSLADLHSAVLQAFRGLACPSRELVQLCLESYASQADPQQDAWQLRSADQPAARRADLKSASARLAALGQRFGYALETGAALTWRTPDQQVAHRFYLSASAVLGEILLEKKGPGPQTGAPAWIVVPGSRANLVSYKINQVYGMFSKHPIWLDVPNDTLKTPANEAGWRFIKFRRLDWLLSQTNLSVEHLASLMSQDPLVYSGSQMRLF